MSLRPHPIVLAIATIAGPAHASYVQPCLPDENVDGRPLFGGLYQRPNTAEGFAFPSGGTPVGMALADLDSDGWLDIVVANNEGGQPKEISNVGILYGQGDGILAATKALETAYGWETCDVAIGDFDADGDLDIAAANAAEDTVSVFLNLGAREFAPQTLHDVGDSPRSIIAADLDADGLDDLATANTGSHDVSILLASGRGGFHPAQHHDAGVITPRADPNLNFPYPGPAMDAADLDADGDIDLAVPSDDKIRVLLNDGAGAFQPGPDHPPGLGDGVYAVRIADLDNDGHNDLAAASLDEDEGLGVVLADGAGAWHPPAVYDADFPGDPIYLTSLALGDLDNDGDLDAAIGEEFHHTILLFRNDGDGTFGPKETLVAPRGPWLVALEDLSADGWTDLAFVSFQNQSSLHVWLGDQAGGLHRPRRIMNPEYDDFDYDPRYLRAGDLDADGDTDAVAIRTPAVMLIENTGGPEPVVADTFALPYPNNIDDYAIADMDADTHPDLVTLDLVDQQDQEVNPRVRTLLGDGALGFEIGPATDLPGLDPTHLAVADLDADGDQDVIVVGATDSNDLVTDRHAYVLINDGDATLKLTQNLVYATIPRVGFGHDVEIADLDADGDMDAVATGTAFMSPGRVRVLINDATGTFSLGQVMVTPAEPQEIALADLDADGDVDLVVRQWIDGHLVPYLYAYTNDGDATFTLADEQVDPNITPRGHLTIADMNADGIPDVVSAEQNKGVIVLTGRGDGTFNPATRYSAIDTNWDSIVADFDADTRPDVLAVNASGDIQTESFSFLRNLGCQPCPADINDDGDLDVLDFVAFQLLWQAEDPDADCNDDDALDITDFICFQQLFQAGCP